MMTATRWRPRHDDPLLIMAMDHRDSFGKTLFEVVDDQPTPEQLSAIQKAKMLIYGGLQQAAAQLPYGRAGVLVDEQYGSAVISRAAVDPVVLAIPIEASGHDWFTLQWADQWLEHVRAVSPAYAKVLVRDNPDFDAAARRDQFRSLSVVGDALDEMQCRLLFELLVPATPAQLASVQGDKLRYDTELRPALTVQVLADAQAAGVAPALWKVEGLETVEAARSVADQARAGGSLADLIVLGRDAPADRVDHWLQVASQVEEFVGFAIGRSIWQDPIRAWRGQEISDEQAVRDIAGRYLDFARHWQSQPAG